MTMSPSQPAQAGEFDYTCVHMSLCSRQGKRELTGAARAQPLVTATALERQGHCGISLGTDRQHFGQAFLAWHWL